MKSIDLPEILEKGLSLGVKSIFFFAGFPVLGNKDGVVRIGNVKLKDRDIRALMDSTTTPWQQQRFEQYKELDYTTGVSHYGLLRMNAFVQRGSIGLVARPVPADVPSFTILGLPEGLKALTRQRDGLVLVTGPAGCGKSTTMAALVDFINQDRSCHIVTIEDPVEYIHRPKKSIVSQREIGKDTKSYDEALRRVMRQDSDVIFVGEVRDGTLMKMALDLAATGRLVFSTLHTDNVVQTLDRIFDFLSGDEMGQVRSQVAQTLRGIVCQRLIPRADGKGFACASELMRVNYAVRNLIREGKIHQIPSVIGTGNEGMITMDQDLLRLNRMGIIGMPDAITHSSKDRSFIEKIADRSHGAEGMAKGKNILPMGKEAIIYQSEFGGGRLGYFDGSGNLLDTPMGLLFRAAGAKRKDFHYIADYTIMNGAGSPFSLQSLFHLSYRILECGSTGMAHPFKVRIVTQEKEEIEIPRGSIDLIHDGNWQTITIPLQKVYREKKVKYFMLLFDSDIREIVFNDISFL
ncbi:MAG: hypothetical protein C0392_00205 [Syntrophus sp. (in: bacteria)]|nr:hypothetical protein [Syntrophus sp. (in: bacteria)]